MFWVQGLKKLWCRFRILIHVPFFSGPPGDTYQMDLSLGLFTVFTQKFPVISTIWIPSFILFCFSTICICFFFFFWTGLYVYQAGVKLHQQPRVSLN